MADREFIGDDWFGYLKDEKVPFYIRIRKNTNVHTNVGFEETAPWKLFADLKV